MSVCEVCGNEIVPGSSVCGFCGSRQEGGPDMGRTPFRRKTVNLKYGRPTVETALRRLAVEIDIARSEGVSILVLIHGYGSGGKGGVIREECRRTLDQMRSTGEINDFIPGDGGARSGPVKSLLRRFPRLRQDRELVAANPGITVVVL